MKTRLYVSSDFEIFDKSENSIMQKFDLHLMKRQTATWVRFPDTSVTGS